MTAARRLRRLLPYLKRSLVLHQGRLRHRVYIAASPYKTGTTSLGRALIELGAGTRDMGHAPRLIRLHQPLITRLNRMVDPEIGARDFLARHGDEVRREMRRMTAALARFDVFSDAPFGHTMIHPFLRKAVAPKARFIWLNRDFDAWIDSVRNWELSHPGTYPDHRLWIEAPERQIQLRRRLWQRSLRDFQRLEEAFPEDCLRVSLTSLTDYRTLARFCGLPPPEGPFPRLNTRDDRGRAPSGSETGG
ncbi:sulfotransferase [Frigidibacter sp. ROC022]|uniref:sulfotransferase n=1 Tax=Frigidibacter sp. ROC022 TaxID=2971796 RepID=UPI00215B6132|nr:sulfotransferase [Frigidibacter sp. ROC022]MCR8726827.1 hypothetical protein [Frigidibacter sp. ROC022]